MDINSLIGWTNTNSGFSGWVQAVGSILAIGGAYILGERQAKLANANAIAADKRTLEDRQECFVAITKLASEFAVNMQEVYKHGPPSVTVLSLSQYSPENVGQIKQALAEIPIHEVGSAEGVRHLCSMRQHFGYLATALFKDDDLLYSEGSMNDEEIENKRIHCHDMVHMNVGNITIAHDKFETSLSRLG